MEILAGRSRNLSETAVRSSPPIVALSEEFSNGDMICFDSNNNEDSENHPATNAKLHTKIVPSKTFSVLRENSTNEQKVDDWLDHCPPINDFGDLEQFKVTDWEPPDEDEEHEEAGPLALPRQIKGMEWEMRTQPNSIIKLTFAHFLPKVMDGTFLCQFSYIESQSRFFLVQSDDSDLYEDLMDDLQDVGDRLEHEGVQLNTFLPGTPCIARFGEDGLFYRAIVVEASFVEVKVQYLDFGNQEQVQYSDIYPLPESLASLPARALACALNGTKPTKLTRVLKDKFEDDFPDGKEVSVTPVSPLDMGDEFEDRWWVQLFDAISKVALTDRYNTERGPIVALEEGSDGEDDDDDDTICDGDTLVAYHTQ